MARTLRINRSKSHSNISSENSTTGNTVDTSIGESTGLESTEDVAGNESESISTDTWKSNDNDGVIDPATLSPTSGSNTGTDSGGSDTTRRRGRPAGSKNGTRKNGKRKDASEATTSIEKTLFTIHMMGAAFLGVPELMLTADESKNLSEAITTVTELYEIPFLDEKTQAWISLAIVAGSIYVPRVIAVSQNAKRKRLPHIVSQ
jgi:hypothetical protein